MAVVQENLSVKKERILYSADRRFHILATLLENCDYKCIGEYIESGNGWTFFTMETEDERFTRISFLRSPNVIGVNLLITGNPSKRLTALIRKEVEDAVLTVNTL
ncbi:hypothetical protein IQ283_08510 (plasmid) [Alkalihalobacillus hwajinpoensis]|uniref:hypothetical protein n=1 Tax=Guptibacillus hwajinpoensis TaxID=208199 RepID=UPI0018842F5C|nr:hypothetical protein [Pseudalkalibacillus hwajinpoensis]MBF0706651.1 hypothetical protein [Pseudalkalibacillus hwajinpoensis]